MASHDLEFYFHAHYARIVRVIANITRDSSRAEELAVDVFLKLPRSAPATGAWLTRAAVRSALDELRRRQRSLRLDALARTFEITRQPDEIYAASSRHEKVASVLRAMKKRDAELVVLRAEGMSYEELAAALNLHPGSVGKLLERANERFRKEYVKRYGTEE